MTDAMTDLPPICDVLLDDATVDQLFFDVDAAAEFLGASIRPAGATRADERPATLADARAAVRAGGGAQLRYRHGGEQWWDTLMPTPAGVRLVRISHTRACAGSAD